MVTGQFSYVIPGVKQGEGLMIHGLPSWLNIRTLRFCVVIALLGTAIVSAQQRNAFDRAPVRVIRDTYPTYSAVAMDHDSNLILLQDENLFGIKAFDRLTNTPASARFSEPKYVIGGDK